MSIFQLEIDQHAGQFGENNTAERACIIGLLQQCAQRVGSGHPYGTVNNPMPLILNGQQVGRFWAGSDSHVLKGR